MNTSIRQFAKDMGVTGRAIRKAIDSKRISPKAVGTRRTKSGKTQPIIVDPVLAAHGFSKNTDHRRASDDKPLQPGVANDIAAFRLLREKAKAKIEFTKMQKAMGEVIPRLIAHQAAASAAHAALNDLRKAVSAKRLTKDELLAVIDACERAFTNTIDKHFALNAD